LKLTGDIIIDANLVIKELGKCKNEYLKPCNDLLEQSRPFVRENRMTKKANESCWNNGNYEGLKSSFLGYVMQERILDPHINKAGVVVMTMHKSKGREFDGVILFSGSYGHSIDLPDDDADFSKTRTLVRVAMTRARHYGTLLYQEGKLPIIFR